MTPGGQVATVGAGTDSVTLNSRATELAQRLAATCQDILALAKYVDGQALAGLEQAGFTSPDAMSFQQGAGYMKTVARVFQGTAAAPEASGFSDAIASFVGPNPSGSQ